MANLNYNRIILAGNLVANPILRWIDGVDGQRAVCNFRLGISEFSKAEGSDKSVYVDCAAWGPTAEAIDKHCRAGRNVFIEGRLRLETWTTNEKKQTKHSVVVDRCQFL
jgi:single-strand DNA-binding protein